MLFLNVASEILTSFAWNYHLLDLSILLTFFGPRQGNDQERKKLNEKDAKAVNCWSKLLTAGENCQSCRQSVKAAKTAEIEWCCLSLTALVDHA